MHMIHEVTSKNASGRKRVGGKTVVATVIASALVVIATACGSATAETDTPTNATSASTATSVAGTTINGFATKKELAEDSQGRKFVKTTLTPDDKLLTYQPEQITAQTSSLFSAEEILAAQKVAMRYYAEELTDSILKGDNITKADRDLWWESVKDDIDPEQAQEFSGKLNTYDAKNGAVYENPERATKGYSLDYGKDNIQLLSREIELNRVVGMEQGGKKYVAFNADIHLELPVTKNGEKSVEKVVATGQVVMRQITPGVWKNAGATVSISSVEYSK